MNFVHPEMLWLAPLIAAPLLIHLLNRLRYHRQRWAAIDFLLAFERRAVRRARLKQLLLMMLRMLLLACALGALAQPVLRGRIAALLGGSKQVAVLLDASASMDASGRDGRSFDRARKLAVDALAALPRDTRVTGGTFAARYESDFGEPIRNRDVVASALEAALRTDGAGNVPAALREAAGALRRGGGGGTIWLLTDMQASDWHADDAQAWQHVRDTLQEAGRPRVLVTDVGAGLRFNLAVGGCRLEPSVVVEGDRAALQITVQRHGEGRDEVEVNAFLDGVRVASRRVEFEEAGPVQVSLQLAALTGGTHVGRVVLGRGDPPADDFRADNSRPFIIRTRGQSPVLVVDGAPSDRAFAGAADFVALAVEPPYSEVTGRSSFDAETIPLMRLKDTALSGHAAVVLADVPRLSPDELDLVTGYVDAGGCLIVLPGANTDAAAWSRNGLPGLTFGQVAEAPQDSSFRAVLSVPTRPVVAGLDAAGLHLLKIHRMFRLGLGSGWEELIGTTAGDALLARRQLGRGRIYAFAVSPRDDFSNLPLTPVLLLALHRAVLAHMVDAARPLSVPAYASLRLNLADGLRLLQDPGGVLHRLDPPDGTRPEVVFESTGRAGVYWAVTGEAPDESDGAAAEGAPARRPLAAVHVPAEESVLNRVDARTVRDLLAGFSVAVTRARGGRQRIEPGATDRAGAAGFPLAAAALVALVGEVALAWSIGRPTAGRAERNGTHNL